METLLPLELGLAQLPNAAGVYRFYDVDQRLLYVGKAKVLKHRVRSYFQPSAKHPIKVRTLVEQVAYLHTTLTSSELEALILEDSLIKHHQPPYNILLRDDKRFPWVGITAEAYPRLFITRNPKQGRKRSKRQRLYGPFTKSSDLYQLLDVLKRHFPLRQRKTPLYKDKPCMNYHIGVCSGPCQKLITPEAYQAVVDAVVWVLKGQTQRLEAQLQAEMLSASEQLQFELAGVLKQRLSVVQKLGEKQCIVSDDAHLHCDAIAAVQEGGLLAVHVLVVRGGRIIASKPFSLQLGEGEALEEGLNAFVRQYYHSLDDDELPELLLLEATLPDALLLGEYLSQRRGKRSELKQPQKGGKADLLALAAANAQHTLEGAKLQAAVNQKNDPMKALLELQTLLKLPTLPRRIECYDISHFQGSQTVASMVVFTEGLPDKAAYRYFNIQESEGKPDDFQSHAEAMRRRLGHLETWGRPDLLLIDGGKGQLSSVAKVLREQGQAQIPAIAIAKRLEEVFRIGNPRPLLLPMDSPTLFLLQQLRDEAHRFGITQHRKRRNKAFFEASS